MHLSFCSTVLLFATRGLRKTSSLQSLSYPRATLCMLRDLMTTEDTKYSVYFAHSVFKKNFAT